MLMSHGVRDLPPLDALLVFETAWRFRSFTKAADHLGVQQPAVSRRIAQIEAWLGTPLFDRAPGGLDPTRAGEALMETVEGALDGLERTGRTIRRVDNPATVVLDVTIGFASGWLFERLGRFRNDHDDVTIELRIRDVVNQHVDVAESDIVVSFGTVADHDEHVELFGETFFPVCSANYADQHGPVTALNLSSHRLLYFRQTPGVQEWDALAAEHGLRLDTPPTDRIFDSYMGYVHAMLNNEGIGLGWDPVFNGHLDARALVVAVPICARTPLKYSARPTRRRDLTPHIQTVMDWLADEAASTPMLGSRMGGLSSAELVD